MKILTVCEIGTNRSVVTRHMLAFDHDVIACGVKTNSQETLKMLCDWADVILLAEPIMMYKIPYTKEIHAKVDTRFTIGIDIYPARHDKHLMILVRKQLKELKYI
jgi:cellobiose-specific phosphotransferase system component IIB